jgi:hypothetical protein
VTRFALADALGASVRVGDARVGKVVGIYLDMRCERAIGLEVAGAGDVRRFLPWVVASFQRGSVCASSTLHLLDGLDGYYERHGAVALHDPEQVAGLSVSVDGRLHRDSEPVSVSAELVMGTSLA